MARYGLDRSRRSRIYTRPIHPHADCPSRPNHPNHPNRPERSDPPPIPTRNLNTHVKNRHKQALSEASTSLDNLKHSPKPTREKP